MNRKLKVLHAQPKTSSTSSQFSVKVENYEMVIEMFEMYSS